MKSTVLIISASLQSAANDVAAEMGWGPNSYSVPLTNTGSKEATHFGLHTFTSNEFEGWITGNIPLPEGMEAAQPVIDNLIYSFRTDVKNRNHFDAVLEANGLQPVLQDDIENLHT